jgi:hypothetical protein
MVCAVAKPVSNNTAAAYNRFFIKTPRFSHSPGRCVLAVQFLTCVRLQ